MRISSRVYLICLFFNLFTITPLKIYAQDKLPVPAEPQQQEARKIVSEVYEEDYRNADSNAERTALARSMTKVATETEDAVNRYVLLQVAMRISASAKDVSATLDTIDVMDRFYHVDAIRLKASAVEKHAVPGLDATQRRQLAGLCDEMSREAAIEARFDLADGILAVGLRLARESRDAEQAKKIELRRNELQVLARRHAQVKDALSMLATEPTDPISNLEAGKYYCFVMDDWHRGLPMLARSGDPTYGEIARRELANPAEPDRQAALGDLWLAVAKKSTGTDTTQQLLRAQHWLEKAAPQLRGFTKLEVQNELETLSKLDLTFPFASIKPVRPTENTSMRPLPETGEIAAQLTELTQLRGHEKPVIAVKFVADGKLIASTDTEKTIIWDVEAGKMTKTLRNGADGLAKVTSMAVSPDGTTLAVTQNGGLRLTLHDVATGKEILEIGNDLKLSVSSGQFSSSGGTFGGRAADHVILWDTGNWRMTQTLRRTDMLRHWCFSPDGTLVGVVGLNGIEVWDAATGGLRKRTQIETRGLVSLCFSPDNRLLVVSTASHTMEIYDVESLRRLRTVTDRLGTVRSVIFHPRGVIFASGDAYANTCLWHAYSGEKLFAKQAPNHNQTTSVHFSPDGDRLVTAHTDGQVKIWEVRIDVST